MTLYFLAFAFALCEFFQADESSARIQTSPALKKVFRAGGETVIWFLGFLIPIKTASILFPAYQDLIWLTGFPALCALGARFKKNETFPVFIFCLSFYFLSSGTVSWVCVGGKILAVSAAAAFIPWFMAGFRLRFLFSPPPKILSGLPILFLGASLLALTLAWAPGLSRFLP